MSSVRLPNSLKQVSLFFERLPGIGAKTANRLAFYLLRLPERDLQEVAGYLSDLKKKTKKCSICNNLTEDSICSICSDPHRDSSVITVVEDVVDLLSFEQGNIYNGLYHVLHGKIDPLNHVSPEDIYIDNFLTRIKTNESSTKEVVLATNPDMEGEATAMYIRNCLEEIKQFNNLEYTITRIGYGLPMGGNIEYVDYITLQRALENRQGYHKE